MRQIVDLAELTLVLPAQRDPARDAVRRAWIRAQGSTHQVDRFWNSPLRIEAKSVRLYGPSLFCGSLAKILGVVLVSPDDSLVARLPARLQRRRIWQARVGQLGDLDGALFVKPIEPKLFPAQIVRDHASLTTRYSMVNEQTPILVSEVVTFDAEVRVFVLDREIVAAAAYAGRADVARAIDTTRGFLALPQLASTFVVDVGYITGRGWAVIELNAVWNASPRRCRVDAVVRCIAAATTRVAE